MVHELWVNFACNTALHRAPTHLPTTIIRSGMLDPPPRKRTQGYLNPIRLPLQGFHARYAIPGESLLKEGGRFFFPLAQPYPVRAPGSVKHGLSAMPARKRSTPMTDRRQPTSTRTGGVSSSSASSSAKRRAGPPAPQIREAGCCSMPRGAQPGTNAWRPGR